MGRLARHVGVSPDAVRYYERFGLLPAPLRSPGGYRLYDGDAIDRLRFIQGCQRLGLRLREIAELLKLRETGDCPCEPAGELLRRRIAEVDVELSRLGRLRAELAAMVSQIPGEDCPDPTPGTWRPERR